MASEYTPSRGRRSNGRGGRRPQGRQGGSSSHRQEPAKPQKKTLWQKIVSIFGGKDDSSISAKDKGYGTTTTPPPRRSERSERPERSERAERPERAERSSSYRKPELIEVTSPRIYVGNLSFDATESDLSELFSGVGLVQNVELVANRHTQKSKGFAFVQMQTTEEAQRAVTELHDKEYMGRKLVVSGAKAVEEKRSERVRQPEQ